MDFEANQDHSQTEALKEKERLIDITYVEKLIERVRVEQDKNRELVDEASNIIALLSEEIEKMGKVGLEEEKQELESLHLRLSDQFRQYKEFFKI